MESVCVGWRKTAHHVRMVELGKGLRFPIEPDAEVGAVGIDGVKNLQGNVTFRAELAGTINGAKSTGAELAEDLISTQNVTFQSGSRKSGAGERPQVMP